MRTIAGHDLLDLRRQRGVWTGLLLIPFVTVSFLLLLPGVIAQMEQRKQRDATYRVAVEAAPGEAAALLARLELPSRFVVEETTDARQQVLSSAADVGVRFAAGAPQRLEQERPVEGEALVLSGRARSRLALAELAAALDAIGLRVVDQRLQARQLAPAAARPFVVEDVDLSTSPRGRRLELATLLPLLVLLPLSGAVGVAAQRISGSKDQRVFEPLLVLPLTRVELLLGKAASAWTIGTISLVALALPLLLGGELPLGAGGRPVHLPPLDVLGVVAIGALLLSLLVGLGVAVGGASRTSAELGSVLQMVTLPLFLMGSFLQFRSGIATSPPLLVLPFFGPLLCVRDVGIGALVPGDLALAAAATVTWILVALAAAARSLESERSVVRSIS